MNNKEKFGTGVGNPTPNPFEKKKVKEIIDPEVEASFQEYWADIIMNKDGTVNLEQVKKELHDYTFMLNEVPKVYCEVSGGLLSYPNYYASSVIESFENHIEKLFEERYKEMVNEIYDAEDTTL